MYSGQNFGDRCIVSDGRPAANISFYLDGEKIEQGLEQTEVFDQNETVTVARLVKLQISSQISIIYQPTVEDTTKIYYLIAKKILGQEVYRIMIQTRKIQSSVSSLEKALVIIMASVLIWITLITAVTIGRSWLFIPQDNSDELNHGNTYEQFRMENTDEKLEVIEVLIP